MLLKLPKIIYSKSVKSFLASFPLFKKIAKNNFSKISKKMFWLKQKFFQMLSWTSSLHKTNFVGCIVYRYRSLQYKWNCTFSLSSMLSTIGKLSTLRNPSYWLVEAVNSLRWEEFFTLSNVMYKLAYIRGRRVWVQRLPPLPLRVQK